ncbi:MAG: cobalamin biosynthesis protein CbiA [Desulfobacteraceae bacterium]
MQIGLSGIVIVVGNYGSGKTEVAINLAVHQHRLGAKVRMADLDLVNPYFRTREARTPLSALGIEVVLPPERLMQADLPILMPQVAGLIRAPGDLAILDVGGDDAGATVLASLADVFKDSNQPTLMIQVVNPFRPNTDSVERCLGMRRAIEASARMPVQKWVGNANFMDETTVDHIYQGDAFMASLKAASGLEVEFLTVPHHILPQIDTSRLSRPVLPIYRQLVPPWQKAVTLP